MSDEPETYPPCRCGREIKKLNAASDDAKCVGCGYVEELCRCRTASPKVLEHEHRAKLRGRYGDWSDFEGVAYA